MCACSLAVDACLFNFIVEELEPLNTSKLDPSKVKFASAFTVVPPSDVNILLLLALFNVLIATLRPVKLDPSP